jgi:hypothetical protein
MNKVIAKFVADSANRKISSKEHKVSTTYTSIEASCPTTCELRKDKSCYAMGGPIAIHLKALDKNAKYHTPDSVAVQEAQLIEASFNGGDIPQDGAKGGRDLRIHGFGDARTKRAAKRLGKAATNWRSRKGGSVWTYTHAWKNVSRELWGKDISILASVDNKDEIELAKKQGYATCTVVPEFKNGAKIWEENGIKYLPCPAQVNKEVTCVKCRLCFRDEFLSKNNFTITFAAHGSGTSKIKKRLNVVK